MSNLKKKVSFILSMMMLALAIIPMGIVSASSNNDDVTMYVKLNGKTEMKYAYEYEVVGGDKINVSAKSNTASTIAFIGYYYYDEGIQSVKDVNASELTITLPAEPAGTERVLVIEAVAESNQGPEDNSNRTGWQFYYLKWIAEEEANPVVANVKYNGKTLADRSTTTTAVPGDKLELVGTPSDKVKTLWYQWDKQDPTPINGSYGTITIPSSFVPGSTHYLYVVARDINGNDTTQKAYKFIIPENTVPAQNPTDDDLEILPWEKENKELESLAISLRNDSESKKANKNFYALDEEVTYFVDFKNGGKDIKDEVVIKLELPLTFKVIAADNGVVDTKKGTITWIYPQGMEKGYEGTKTVKVKYTAFDKKNTTSQIIYPLATIAKAGKVADSSAVINFIYVDSDTTLEITHEPYMYGDANATTFRPDDTITRAEGALVLTRILLGQSAIDKVRVTSVYPDLDQTYLEAQKAIIAATSYGIINGYTDGYYRPNQTMTRAEFMKIIAKFIEINAEDEGIDGLNIKNIEDSVKLYKDPAVLGYRVNGASVANHWALEEVTLLNRLNMTDVSKNKNLRMDEGISRAEVAQLVNFYTFRAPAEITSRVTTQFSDVSRKHNLFADIVEATRPAHEFRVTEDATEIAK